MSRTGLFPLMLMALLLVSCLSPPWIGSRLPWTGAKDFTSGLRCQMTEADIKLFAKTFPRLSLHQPDGWKGRLVGQKGDTMIVLELEAERLLTRYQVSWTSGLTRQSFELKNDLCSGQQLVTVAVVGSPRLAGAALLLNGEPAAMLSSQGTALFDVLLGEHTLVVRHEDAEWSTLLRYDTSSSGWDRLPVPTDAFSDGDSSADGDGASEAPPPTGCTRVF